MEYEEYDENNPDAMLDDLLNTDDEDDYLRPPIDPRNRQQTPEPTPGKTVEKAEKTPTPHRKPFRKKLYTPTKTQIKYLQFLGTVQLAFVEHIAATFGRSPSSVSSQMKILENNGYVKTETMGSNRKMYYLSRKAISRLEDWDEMETGRAKEYDDNTIEKFLHTLGGTLAVANTYKYAQMSEEELSKSNLKLYNRLPAELIDSNHQDLMTEKQVTSAWSEILTECNLAADEHDNIQKRNSRAWKFRGKVSPIIARKPNPGLLDRNDEMVKIPDMALIKDDKVYHIEIEMVTKGIARYKRYFELYRDCLDQFEKAIWFFGSEKAQRDFHSALTGLLEQDYTQYKGQGGAIMRRPKTQDEKDIDAALRKKIIQVPLILLDGRFHRKPKDQF